MSTLGTRPGEIRRLLSSIYGEEAVLRFMDPSCSDDEYGVPPPPGSSLREKLKNARWALPRIHALLTLLALTTALLMFGYAVGKPHSSVRYRVVFALVCLVLASLLVALRRRWRKLYGYVEIATGLVIAVRVVLPPANPVEHGLFMLGAIYVMVRGLDNTRQFQR